MLILKANLETGILTAGRKEFGISCKVRQVRTGTRHTDEVVRTIPSNLPYDPQPFPQGSWSVTGVEWSDKYLFSKQVYGPVKIRTNAYQEVKVWELDHDYDYAYETEKQVVDRGYLLHYSPSTTTLGCIRIATEEEAIELAKLVETYLMNCIIEVI